MTVFTTLTIVGTTCSALYIGMIVYARYGTCDPLLNGQVQSRDMLTTIFAMELFANTPGMFGLYVAAILCATLSTLSSVINAFATVTLMDFIKPHLPNATDAMSTAISKLIAILYGLLIMSLTGVTHYFGGLNQALQAIAGTQAGPTGGILLLGIFFPWATAKGATVGYVAGNLIGWWLSFGRISVGAPYTTAPMSTSGCNATPHGLDANFHSRQIHRVNFTQLTMLPSVNHSGEDLQDASFLYLIIPLWYGTITLTTVLVVGLLTSFATGSEDLQKLDPKLISPFTKYLARLLPEALQKKSGLATLLANDRKLSELKDVKNADGHELQTLNTEIKTANDQNFVD